MVEASASSAGDVPQLALADLIAALGSTSPTPGSGVAGAIALALGAACAAKAFAISARHAGDPGLTAAAQQARSLAAIALEGAQRDAEDFRRWLESRDAAAVHALQMDARTLSALAEKLDSLIVAHRHAVIASLAPDIEAASDLTRAFTAISTRNLQEH